MAKVEIDIPVTESLLAQADQASKEMEITRSQLFVSAITEFLRRRESQGGNEEGNEYGNEQESLGEVQRSS